MSTGELSAMVADHFNLSEDDRALTYAQGRLRYKNRVAWAVGHLSDAGLLDKVAEGEYRITSAGKDVLDDHPTKIDLQFLSQFPRWIEARRPQSARPSEESTFPSRVGRTRLGLRIPNTLVMKAKVYSASHPGVRLQDMVEEGLELYFARHPPSEEQQHLSQDFVEHFESDLNAGIELDEDIPPNEVLERVHKGMRQSLANDLLTKVKQAPPEFFERLVLDLLLRMGYGGSRPDAGSVTRRGADGGIDGVINEDKLGLDRVYLQAKRWNRTVGSPEVREFAGSLEQHRAEKGVFITTSQFSPDAQAYVSQIGKKIVLIDGEELSAMMIDYNVGVSVAESYAVKKVDSDYFTD